MFKTKMTADEIASLTDRELQAIMRSTRRDSIRFAEERALAVHEMARRSARAYRVKFDQYD